MTSVLYAPAAQSCDRLLFFPCGTGRYEFLNWGLCSTELFHWNTSQIGSLSIIGDRHLQVSIDSKHIEVQPSLLGNCNFSYLIDEEMTPIHGRIRVLRIPFNRPMADAFGFKQLDLKGLEQPDFPIESD